MRGEEDHSQIAQQNILMINPQPALKYVSFHDIQKYENQSSAHHPEHQCLPSHFSWSAVQNSPLLSNQTQLANNENSRQIMNNNSGLVIKSLPLENSQEYIIQQPLLKCCLDTKLHLSFSLRRYNYVQIYKICAVGNTKQIQQGVSYRISHAISVLKIQISIAPSSSASVIDRRPSSQPDPSSKQTAKIWKQIELPIKNYQSQVNSKISIVEKTNGEICLTVDEYEFMLKIKLPVSSSCNIAVRSDGNIYKLELDQTNINSENDIEGGCTESKCHIF